MIGGYFDENDPDAIGVLDPHLGQSPGLCGRFTQDVNASRSEPVVLGVNVPYLEPDHHRAPRSARRVPGDFQEAWAEEEHHRGISRRAELPVDGQPQHVAVETAASIQVGGAQQDPATQYLHTFILAAPAVGDRKPCCRNIDVRYRVAVTGGAGRDRLESLTLTDLESGTPETVAAAALFVLIGAEPRTQWLPGAVRLDPWGFVVTGTDLLQDGQPHQEWPLRRMPMFLESSLPGVFAVGDVRHGSLKRVAAAVGEGSTAIRLVHDHLRAE